MNVKYLLKSLTEFIFLIRILILNFPAYRALLLTPPGRRKSKVKGILREIIRIFTYPSRPKVYIVKYDTPVETTLFRL